MLILTASKYRVGCEGLGRLVASQFTLHFHFKVECSEFRLRSLHTAAADPADGVGRYIIPTVSTAAAAAVASDIDGACVGAAIVHTVPDCCSIKRALKSLTAGPCYAARRRRITGTRKTGHRITGTRKPGRRITGTRKPGAAWRSECRSCRHEIRNSCISFYGVLSNKSNGGCHHCQHILSAHRHYMKKKSGNTDVI